MSQDNVITDINDAQQFQITRNCMSSVGIDDIQQFQIFSLIAGILNLGNVEFEIDNAEGQVGPITDTTMPFFMSAAKVLGLEVSH